MSRTARRPTSSPSSQLWSPAAAGHRSGFIYVRPLDLSRLELIATPQRDTSQTCTFFELAETRCVLHAARFASGAYALQIQADYPQYVEEMIEENAGGRR